ncbi:MAG: hypothetical protein Q8R18_02275 [bacterium]|nr:hypothetical protein [bacterium]
MRQTTRLIRLEKEKRFHRKKTMFYRSNLLLHTERVAYLLEQCIPYAEEVFGKEFNSPMARGIAKVFDDFEIEMGEISPEERILLEIDNSRMEERRKDAARRLISASNGLSIDGFAYGTLLNMARRRGEIEAQIVNWCDSFNGFGESLHEVYAGNARIFMEPVECYIKKLRAFPDKHPKLNRLFERIPEYFAIPYFEEPTMPHLHTENSIKRETGYAPYDSWKRTIIKSGEEKGLISLIRQKEYLSPVEQIDQTNFQIASPT